jgi:inorganic triphosphatase YgiF
LEVEAKFSIPDKQTFQRLLEANSLVGLDLEKRDRIEILDRYLDTPDCALWAMGYACRLRQYGNQYQGTLKGPGQVSGALHRRAEYEVELSGPCLPPDWPQSTARELTLRLLGTKGLRILFKVKQTRHCRRLLDGARAVAEITLDHVHLLQTGHVQASFLEMEAELLDGAKERYLFLLAQEMVDMWRLEPQPRSKFERGLALFGFETGMTS